MTKKDRYFMKRAIKMAENGMDSNAEGPFGCVIIKDNEIIAEEFNKVPVFDKWAKKSNKTKY